MISDPDRSLVDTHPLQGWGLLLSQFSLFHYFPHFPLLWKQTSATEYDIYIWQVLPQLSCGDTCQIWMWFRESNRYFCKIENFAYGEISKRSFSNPHTWGLNQSKGQIRAAFQPNKTKHSILTMAYQGSPFSTARRPGASKTTSQASGFEQIFPLYFI